MNPSSEHIFTDKHLVEQVQNGDHQAFARIIRHTEKLVAQIVFKMIQSQDDRQDIVQDVYLKAFKNISGFRFNAKLSTWIGKITYNTCLHYLEKKRLVFMPEQAEKEDQDDMLDYLQQKQQDPFHKSPEKDLSGRELSSILATAIKKLHPPIYQTLISLYHQEELSYTEIAEITSLPEGTVKNYLFRARKALKQQLLSKYKKEEL